MTGLFDWDKKEDQQSEEELEDDETTYWLNVYGADLKNPLEEYDGLTKGELETKVTEITDMVMNNGIGKDDEEIIFYRNVSKIQWGDE